MSPLPKQAGGAPFRRGQRGPGHQRAEDRAAGHAAPPASAPLRRKLIRVSPESTASAAALVSAMAPSVSIGLEIDVVHRNGVPFRQEVWPTADDGLVGPDLRPASESLNLVFGAAPGWITRR